MSMIESFTDLRAVDSAQPNIDFHVVALSSLQDLGRANRQDPVDTPSV